MNRVKAWLNEPPPHPVRFLLFGGVMLLLSLLGGSDLAHGEVGWGLLDLSIVAANIGLRWWPR